MKKIPTALVRNPDDRAHVLDEVTPGCEWVIRGEGVPTRKYDGTCVMLEDGYWWARREVKPGKDAPHNYVPEETDAVTGKTVGWEPIEQSPFAKFHAEALTRDVGVAYAPGTYELIGPKINGNPEHRTSHELVAHATATEIAHAGAPNVANVISMVRAVGEQGWEGIVWHHPDGRMAKLKYRDIMPPIAQGGIIPPDPNRIVLVGERGTEWLIPLDKH